MVTALGREVLERLADIAELPRRVVEYRKVQKLCSTYLSALPKEIQPGGKIVLQLSSWSARWARQK